MFTMTHQFKPETSALVLIDYQVGTLQLVKNSASDVALRNVVNLAKAAKAPGMPVVLTTSEEGLGALVREMVEMVAEDVRGGVIADCGHFLPEECPDEVVRQVRFMTGKVNGH